MQIKTRTIRYPHGFYLHIQDSEGADTSFLMLEGETVEQCLSRNIKEEQRKIDVLNRRVARMSSWSNLLAETV